MQATQFTILALNDNSLKNGSFLRVIYGPLWARGITRYINGDFVGYLENPKEPTVLALQTYEASFVNNGGYTIYAKQYARELAPKGLI